VNLQHNLLQACHFLSLASLRGHTCGQHKRTSLHHGLGWELDAFIKQQSRATGPYEMHCSGGGW
jgi:hypothetical protein